MEKVNIETAFKELRAGNRNIYFEVNVVEIQKQKQTPQGNCFFRIKIKDETLDVILVVWGSNWNQPNLKIFESLAPKRIRVIKPKLPSQWAVERYGVDFWADEIISKIELIKRKKGYSKTEFKLKYPNLVDFYQSEEWNFIRNLVLQRDSFKCRLKTTQCIEIATIAHHVLSVHYNPEHCLDPEYIIAVCKLCHEEWNSTHDMK